MGRGDLGVRTPVRSHATYRGITLALVIINTINIITNISESLLELHCKQTNLINYN